MRVLIPTGGIGHSDLAVQLGNNFTEAVGGEAVILHVVRHEHERARGEALLKRARRLWAPHQRTPEVKIRVGEPAGEVVAEAREGQYRFIVMGEPIHYRILPRLLSPTGERIIAQAPCPVLVAKSLTREFRQILVCDSGANQETLVTRLTTLVPELLTPETEVTVLHVMSQIGAAPGVPGWQLRADAKSLIEARTPEGELLVNDLEVLEQSTAQAAAKVRHGSVVEEILAEVESDTYDLVVIGTHRMEGWQRYLLDDIARKLIHDIQRPILVIQQKQ